MGNLTNTKAAGCSKLAMQLLNMFLNGLSRTHRLFMKQPIACLPRSLWRNGTPRYHGV